MLLEHSGSGRWPDTLRLMRQAQEEVNRVLGGLNLAADIDFPPVNLWTGADGALIAAEIPGISPDQLDVTVHRDIVTLRGTREAEKLDDKVTLLRQERPAGEFVRSVALPFRVDAEKTVARFERGVLILELPRPEADKPRRINVMHA